MYDPEAETLLFESPSSEVLDVGAGATFYGDWLFVNIQTPGVTFAIRGPRRRGAL